MNVMEIARPEERADGRLGFVVEPGEMYPAAIAHICQRLEVQARPGGTLTVLYDQASQLPAEAWEWALRPLAACPDGARGARAEALEIARLWFTETLHQAVSQQAIGLHILKDETYRL